VISCQLILPTFLGVGAVAKAIHPLPARVDFLQVFAGDEKKW
jgi:predicted P-loop ATPase